MRKVTLKIPTIHEGLCCRRARTLRRWGLRLNLFFGAVSGGELLAFLLWHKEMPSWYEWIRWPSLIIILGIIFFNHRLAEWFTWIPETPDPDEIVSDLSVFSHNEKPKPKDEA